MLFPGVSISAGIKQIRLRMHSAALNQITPGNPVCSSVVAATGGPTASPASETDAAQPTTLPDLSAAAIDES
jgi:hypothetical protein